MFKKLFLPAGMIFAVILSFLLPELGIAVKKALPSWGLVVTIFLICGYQTDASSFKFNRKFLAAFTVGAVLSLVVSPWLATGLGHLFGLDVLMLAGLVVISAVPPTLSSGVVMTENAGGNVLLSMTLTIGYNLLGVFTLPLMLAWCLAQRGAIDTNPGKMFVDLLLQVLLPSLAGWGVRKMLRRHKRPKWIGHVPSICVILLVLMFFSHSNEMLRNAPADRLLLAALAGFLLHTGLMALMYFSGRAFRFPEKDCKALLFTGGSKTITISLATLAIMKADDGAAMIPCLVFYFVQMMIDSAVAGHMGLRAAKQINS